MTPRYRLHYAPDNASLIIRLALEELGQEYETVLVNRQAQVQRSVAYRALNPNGLIPVLETPDGPMFETAAILLWLADRHGALAPAVDSNQRAGFLKWLFFTSNTLHADLRILFYPERYIGTNLSQQNELRRVQRERLRTHLSIIDAAANEKSPWLCADQPSVLDLYLACLLRWMALYPLGSDRSWMVLAQYPNLHAMCSKLELRASVSAARSAEGLGATPFTSPFIATPPEGTPT